MLTGRKVHPVSLFFPYKISRVGNTFLNSLSFKIMAVFYILNPELLHFQQKKSYCRYTVAFILITVIV